VRCSSSAPGFQRRQATYQRRRLRLGGDHRYTLSVGQPSHSDRPGGSGRALIALPTAVSRCTATRDYCRRERLLQGFEIHYQPQVTLETRTIAEMEALVRLGHPRRGLVMPSEVIQVTEVTGLIVPIGERVLEEACRQATECGYQNGHSTTMTMCVNLSMKQLQDPDLGDKVERALRRAALVAPNPLWVVPR
jgi:EAL domain-containing protein (putative c-di-GMP-specific phosphodiesterase class I)